MIRTLAVFPLMNRSEIFYMFFYPCCPSSFYVALVDRVLGTVTFNRICDELRLHTIIPEGMIEDIRLRYGDSLISCVAEYQCGCLDIYCICDGCLFTVGLEELWICEGGATKVGSN